MKKLLYILGAIILLSSCDRNSDVDLVIGDPTQRITDTIAHIRSTLMGAPNGWIGYTTTERSGGYGFYFDFQEDNKLMTVADLTTTSATTAKESTYRVRQIMAATLVFDTYTYITMLQDPDPGTYEGVAGQGKGSDVEYEYKRTSGDSIFFAGRRFKKDLVLVKATAAQQQSYLGGEYNAAINKSRNFFANTPNPFIPKDGLRYALTTNHTNKSASITALNNGSVLQSVEKFYYTLEGAKPTHTLVSGTLRVTNLTFQGNDLYATLNTGESIKVESSPTPIIPLYLTMGIGVSGFRSPYRTYLPGSSAKGTNILRRFHEGLQAGVTGYVFNSGYIDMSWNVNNRRITIGGFSSQNGGTSGWTTNYVYDYELDSETGIYTLTYRSGPSGGYTGPILDQLTAFLNSSRIRVDYYASGGNLYGQLIGVDDTDVVITFQLR